MILIRDKGVFGSNKNQPIVKISKTSMNHRSKERSLQTSKIDYVLVCRSFIL